MMIDWSEKGLTAEVQDVFLALSIWDGEGQPQGALLDLTEAESFLAWLQKAVTELRKAR